MESKKSIDQIASADGRYTADAIAFVYEGLGYTVRQASKDQDYDQGSNHVSGQELSQGIGKLAIDKWGLLAKTVLNKWGIYNTRDFGEIVYLMIENKWMSSQPEDTIDDFNDVYDFQKFFIDAFDFEMLDKK